MPALPFLCRRCKKYGTRERDESDEKRENFLTRLFDKVKEKLKKQSSPIGIPTSGSIPERIRPDEAFIIEDDDHPMYSLPEHLRPSLSDGDEISEELFSLVDEGALTLDEILEEMDEED
ncbi:MAG: hypothetical protein IKC72_05780 [Clostridia bacterium]|nr:hypothetical protein [Clostridia bacterium]